MTDAIVFLIPQAIRDWVFDIADATRRSLRSSEVAPLYETQFKDLTDRFFPSSPWPEAASLAPECNYDEDFLLFYKEVRVRHLFSMQYTSKDSKHKPVLSDFIDSWSTYSKIFEYILSKPDIDSHMALTPQWVSDIILEYVYQFQGFCQYRCQLQGRSPEDLRTLDSNRNVWSVSDVTSTLKALAKAGSTGDQQLHIQFGYFSSVERARLECLLGDYSESLAAIAHINLGDRSELFQSLPMVHINLFYHSSICCIMLRRYADAISTLGEIALYISRLLKPGNAGSMRGQDSQFRKMLDKVLALTGISSNLSPGSRLDDQVRELAEGKFPEKMRRLANGDIQTFVDLFEMTGPKFISPAVPDYSGPLSGDKDKATMSNKSQEACNVQIALFKQEVVQQLAVLKLRSYMRLYASIDMPKLARFSELSEDDLFCQVLSYKHKLMQVTRGGEGKRVSSSDVHYFVNEGSLVIESSSTKSDKQRQAERYFLGGIRRHSELVADMEKSFNAVFKTVGVKNRE